MDIIEKEQAVTEEKPKEEKPVKVKAFTYHSDDKKFTICGVIDEGKKVMNVGLALKNDMDNYSRKLGHKIALGRALKRPFHTFEIDICPNAGKMFYGYAQLFEKVYTKVDSKRGVLYTQTLTLK